MLKTILYRLGITFALIALLSSCGNDSSVPPDGKLIASPSKFTYTHLGTPTATAGCAGIVNGIGTTTEDLIIRIITTDAKGNLAGKIDFTIETSFAENVSTGAGLTALLINNVLVTGVGDPVPFTATTDSSGELLLTLRYDTTFDLNCVYAGSVTLSSGLQNVIATFEVKVDS